MPVDIYLIALALGVVGLGAMAVLGFSAQGHGGGAHHIGGRAGGHAQGSHGHAGGRLAGGSRGAMQPLIALLSPRVLFSLCLGVGTTGLLLTPVLGGATLLGASLVGGIAFERLFVTPLWNFAFRFESRPALTLESAVSSEATATSTFDADGHGLVAVEVDGQVMQVLGTLQDSHRAMGVTVRAGAKVRIEDVDVARNRCTVSLL